MTKQSQHLFPRDSESPAVPLNFAIWGAAKKISARPRPPKHAQSLHQCE